MSLERDGIGVTHSNPSSRSEDDGNTYQTQERGQSVEYEQFEDDGEKDRGVDGQTCPTRFFTL